MDSLPKVSIGIIGVVILQIGGFIWWTAQQASTISNLESTVSQLSAQSEVQDKVNMQRDIQQNEKEINDIWDDSDDVWNEISALALSINAINELKQRIALLENELKYVNRDHDSMIMQKSGE